MGDIGEEEEIGLNLFDKAAGFIGHGETWL